jgi:hypothetical protein
MPLIIFGSQLSGRSKRLMRFGSASIGPLRTKKRTNPQETPAATIGCWDRSAIVVRSTRIFGAEVLLLSPIAMPSGSFRLVDGGKKSLLCSDGSARPVILCLFQFERPGLTLISITAFSISSQWNFPPHDLIRVSASCSRKKLARLDCQRRCRPAFVLAPMIVQRKFLAFGLQSYC